MSHTENNNDSKPGDSKTIKSEGIKEHIDKTDEVDRRLARKHPFLRKTVKSIGIGLLVAAAVVIKVVTSKSRSSDDPGGTSTGGNSGKRDYPEERSSPREHNVSGYDRQRYGKTEHVNPYSRGGNKDKEGKSTMGRRT